MTTDTLLLDRYEILEPLGEGGFSQVSKAFDKKMERVVAIKTIPTGEKRAIRALREAKTVALLNHPNIVTLYEFEQQDDFYYLIMEYVEGRSLASILDTFGELPVDLALGIAVQVGEALSFAHKNDVIHRDIKPANLRILPDGRVKVMDFGIARLRSAAKTSGLTTEGEVVGTFAYMSPEQASGEMVDERSDVFSLGVLLYEMVTGKLPFWAGTPAGTIYKILNEVPVAAHEIDDSIYPALSEAIDKAMAKDPKDRFPSSEDFSAKLNRLLHKKEKHADVVAELLNELKPPLTEKDFNIVARLGMRLVAWVNEHKQSVSAGLYAGAATIVALWTDAYLPPFLTQFRLFFPVVIFFLSLFLPPVGLAALFAMIAAGAWQVSPYLGGAIALALAVYWVAIGKGVPHIAIAPLLAPALAWINIPFVFPLAVGLIFSPVLAAFLAGFGVLALSFAEVITPIDYPWAVNPGSSLVTAVKFGGAHTDLIDLLEYFRSHPLIPAQAAIWAATAWFMAVLRKLRAATHPFLLLMAGSVCLFLGYRIVPFSLDVKHDFAQLFLQPVVFSFIILAAIIFSFRYFSKRPRA